MTPPPRPSREPGSGVTSRDVWRGIGLLVALHLVFAGVPLAFYLARAEPFWAVGFMAIGVTQALYAVPAYIVARVGGHRGVAVGIAIGAAMTFMLNAAVCGLMSVGI